MATRKTQTFLPQIFQTDTNQKFLSATMDQLVSEPDLTTLYGYIGRKFAPTYTTTDSYVIEPSAERQNYQLEPSIVIKDDQNNITFFATYLDLLDKIKYYGGITTDQSRLFEQEYYTFDPLISYDKFVTFSQYYWLPNGPDPVEVSTSGVDLTATYTVERDAPNSRYIFKNNGVVDNSIILARGGVYEFIVDQPGYPLWIQTDLGVDGKLIATPTLSSRDVLGVENNGTDQGTITFRVPQSTAQNRFLSMPTVAQVAYAAPLPYYALQNKTVSQFLAAYPQYGGITGQLNGKELIFINSSAYDNLGETAWTNGNVSYGSQTANVSVYGTVGTNVIKLQSVQNVYANLIISGTGIANNTTVTGVDAGNLTITLSANLTANVIGAYSFISTAYNPTYNVPDADRFDVWKVVYVDAGINDAAGNVDYLVQLIRTDNINTDEKVYIRYGIGNANKEYYKDIDGFLKEIPLISAPLNNLWVQDTILVNLYQPVQIVEYAGWNIDVETEIIGQQNYTSPNGIQFTSGLKIQFGDDVTPAYYQNRQFYVELVGDLGGGIRLVPVDELVTPESYNIENSINYPLTRIILSEQVTENIPTGTVLTVGATSVQVYEEIIIGRNYFTTLTEVSQDDIGAVVSGTGIPIGTIVGSIRYDTVFPEYITINRASKDRNAWARNNRWFHIDVITKTAEYNGVQPIFDQDSRAQRPIVQFESDIQLINDGRVAKAPIDILDITITNAFSDLQGKTYTKAFGVTLFDGMRIIFGADEDPLVKNKIYILNLVQYDVDANGLPTGNKHINLTIADDGDVDPYSTTVVKLGQYQGSQWWYDGINWNQSQQKTSLQQDPLFDVLDPTGKSISSYPRSTFTGTKIFGYVIGTGTVDPVLGFSLSYKTFQAQGDIRFQNYFNTDTFEYVNDSGIITTEKINLGFVQKIRDLTTLVPKNTWLTVPENSRQYQQIGYVYDGTNNPFKIDIIPNVSQTIPNIKVFQNFVYLQTSQWTLVDYEITVTTNLNIGDQIDILIYSSEISKLGFYQVPQNLDLNAQNIDIDTLTLGQIRNHLVALGQNSTVLTGDILAQSNLRDIDIKQQGGTILQHSSPTPYASLFLIDEKANFINGLRLAQQEYTKFKNKFLELSISLNGIDADDPVNSVDLILTKINQVKNKNFPWFYSDMVPYGPLKNIVGQIGNIDGFEIFDPLKLNYEITETFNDQQLSNKAVLVYLNDVQLIKGVDYNFSTDTPSINFTIDLAVGDIVKIVEYSNTDGNYIPETPSKLGLWPTFVPEIFLDNTYRTPINVIRGHDGSITPAFGDYRDNFLLELELRIFNNIKLPQNSTFGDIFSVIPGKFRDSDYTLAEINQLASIDFLNWIGNNKLDFSTNDTFDPNDPFTWNYADSTDRIDGEKLQGSWRACYQYFYDTIRPHITPWEMLGFSEEPSWWLAFYGPGPYTGGNKLLWDDLEAGLIRYGDRAGIDLNYRRPGLSAVIPVDVNGNLLSPAQALSKSFNSKRSASAWAVGQYGPVEFAWRTSSEFPYAVQQALALAKPGKYFGSLIDTYNYTPLNLLYSLDELSDGTVTGSEQYLTRTTNHHITQDAIDFNGDITAGSVYRGAGYLNWIADYLTNLGINPANYLLPLIRKFQVNLGYKAAGFTDQAYLEVLAEQVSPTSTNASVLIPSENYQVYLNETPVPVNKIIYSAVIVEKTTNGYTVRGYNLFNSFFTIIPSIVNSNASRISVQNKSAIIYNDYQNVKLQIPYGYEFTSSQQLADFLISYERYLIAQGFTFTDIDPTLNEIRNFKLSVKEFLYWIQQGWKPGAVIVLSPVAETINAVSLNSITAGIEDSQYGSKVLDQNFNLIKNNNYTVVRTPDTFKLTLTNSASVLGYLEVNLIQFEHALVFDNTTVFNDVIYQPESGNRQYRLKLIGQKTAGWNGSLSPAGFIYYSGVVQQWNQGQDYLQGDLVQYKNQFYTALQNVTASPQFQFQFWQQIDSSQLKKGLLPNFSTLAVAPQSYYDPYGSVKDIPEMQFSHALIGYKPRQYLADLGLTETTQIEFYKGFIKQKGSANAVNEMLTATFNNLSSEIKFYEEWAMRVGEYGALSSNPFVEIPLDETAFGVNPSVARFVGDADSNLADGINVFNESQLYKSYGQYTGNIALNRTAVGDPENDILAAGYVNIDDVDLTLFDLTNYLDLNTRISDMGSGYLIWVAKDFSQDWNVYRITETNNSVIQITKGDAGYIILTTKTPHNLLYGEVFLVKDFSTKFDSFYQVYEVTGLNTVIVSYTGSTENLTTESGSGILLRLNTMRFKYMEDARVYGLSNPPNGWKVGDKIWIDDDAETTAVQGQPFGTQPSGTWKVYEKQAPWQYQQQLLKSSSEYANTDGYGTSLKMSADGLVVVVGSPYSGNIVGNATGLANTGVVSTFLKNYEGVFSESFKLIPLGANTRAFGSTVDLATSATGTAILGVGAPDSFGNVTNSNIGYVYIYSKPLTSTVFNRNQILVGNIAGDLFGTSIAFNQTGDWLYVGAPGNNRLYAYGYNRFISTQTQTVSINNKNTIFLSSNIVVNVGDTITQSATGATARVLVAGNIANLEITSLTNFYVGATITLGNVYYWANISINSVDLNGVYPTSVSNVAVRNSIPLTFVPDVIINGNVDPNSLLITSDLKTYIPVIDYGFASNALAVGGYDVVFTSGNISQSDITIQQQPYYQLIATIPMSSLGFSSVSDANFGSALSSSFGGEQVGVGAPNDTVNVGVFTANISSTETHEVSIPVGVNTANIQYQGNTWIRKSYTEYTSAGTVYLLDRVIEAFNTISDAVPGTAGQDYRTVNPIATVYKVTLDNVEVNNYIVANAAGIVSGVRDTIRFNSPPPIGRVMFVEVNKFNLLERIVGVDSLEGGLAAIQKDAYFGTSLTICSNNCAIYIGAPNYDNGTEYNSGAVWKFHNRGRLYGTNTGYAIDPTFTPGDTIRLNDFEVVVTGTTLGNLVADINNAGILGVTAANDAGRLRLDSDVTVAKDQLRIVSGVRQPGSAGVLADADLIVFAFMQIIINPYGNPGEYFGNKVKLAANAYLLVIGSKRGTTRKLTTFDIHSQALYPNATDVTKYILDPDSAENPQPTVFDDTTTRWFDGTSGSGSTYIYELYDDPRNAVEDPGRYAFAQQLDPGDLISGSEFGAALDIEGGLVTVSALSGTVDGAPVNSGTVYIFENPALTRGWNLIRYQQPKVELNSVNRIYIYNSQTNSILTDMQFIDPAKGKILGQAEQEISFKTEYDPAIYNKGNNLETDINVNVYWSQQQIGKVWWDLSRVRYVDYEQDSLTYRSLYWGQLFPGSSIDVYEWVESRVLPSQYVENFGDGQPKYPDNSAYAEEIFVDPVTGIISAKYYFWVINKTSVDPNDPTRNIPISAVADLISNPKNQNIAYSAVIRNDAVAFYNVSNYLSADNTIMHLDHQLVVNTDIIHSEYQLVQQGNPVDPIPTKIVNKLIDSLSGIDRNGATVPDPKLSPADRYGVEVRPRQSMFVDRLQAVSEMVSYVNSILIENPIVEQFSLAGMNVAEPIPNIKLNEYDRSVDTEIELSYIDTEAIDPGYLVLVLNDIGQNGLWVLYELSSDKTWTINRVQSYKTSLYWNYADWYGKKSDGTSYSAADKPDFSVATTNDAIKLDATEGQLIYISNATGNNTWQLVEVLLDGSFKVVGIQNGTIQLDDALSDFVGQGLGFGNQDFDTSRYDQNPNTEIRYILTALDNDIFINTLQGEFKNLFFVMVNYLLTEQNYVDWLFKSSFISVTHKLRTLSQFPSFIVDNQTYYEDYIKEVKPYRTEIREYKINYTGEDNFDGDITDFDLPAYYDTSTGYGIFRSPSGEVPYVEEDSATWQTFPYNQWYNNRNLEVSSIRIEPDEWDVNGNPTNYGGRGYVLPPTVTIVSTDGKGSGAEAYATLDTNTGSILSITVTDSGSDYTTTPTVIINGTIIGNINAIGGNVSNTQANTYTLSTVTGLYVGMTANAVFSANTQITSIDTANLRITMDAGNLTTFTGTAISFGFAGQTVGKPAVAYAVMKNNQVRSFDTKIKFDRISYSSTVQEWQPNTAYTLGQIITHARQDGNVMIRSAYRITTSATSGTTFLSSDYADYASSNFDNANDRIVGYYQPGALMPVIDVISIPLTLANAAGNITNGNNTIYTYTVDGIFPGMYISNLGVKAGYITSVIGNVSITVANVLTTCTQIKLSVNVSLNTNDTITARYENLDQLVGGIDYPSATVVSPKFRNDPLFGRYWDVTAYDGVQYSQDGLALLSTNAYDIALYSLYSETLGVDPDNLITIGGEFVDTYHSHAPEELIPGTTFDTLDMRVYTKINSNANIVAYRVFNNMMGDTGYLRISSANSTVLTSTLNITDSEIFVADATKLSVPDVAQVVPGVIFINGERITYYRNYSDEVELWTANTTFANDSILTYGNVITFSSNITANRGEYIAQANIGANAVVTANVINSTTVPIYYLSGSPQFSLGANTIQVTSGINNVQVSEILASANANVWSVSGNSNIRISTTAVLSIGTEIQFSNDFGNVVGNITYYIESVYGNASTNPTVPVSNIIKIANTPSGAAVTDLIPNAYVATANVITIIDYDAYPTISANAYYKTTGNVNSVTFNYANVLQIPSLNILGQIRRGTQGTGSPTVQPIGAEVLDGGYDQLVPATSNIIVVSTTATSGQTLFNTPKYQLGDDPINNLRLRVYVDNLPSFDNAYNEISSNVRVYSYTGTNGNTVNVTVNYGNTISFVSGIAAGSVVRAEVTAQFANVWYNGTGNTIDGTGMTGANTAATNFLRAYSVTSSVIPGISNPMTTEDAINILTTETDDEIYTED
jgi:hypothetical protein